MNSTQTQPVNANMDAKAIIDDLGGPTAVAKIIYKRTGKRRRPQAVSMWIVRGTIPHRWRGTLAMEARELGIGLPAGFLGEGIES